MSISEFCETIRQLDAFNGFSGCSPEADLVRPLHPVIGFHRLELDRSRRERALHGRFFMKVMLDGRSFAHVETNRYRLNPGDGILVFPYQLHYLENGPGCSPVQMRLTAEFGLSETDAEKLRSLRDRPFRLDDDGERLLAGMARSAKRGCDAEAVALLAAFLCRCADSVGAADNFPLPPLFPPSPDARIFRTVFDQYRNGIGVKELLELTGCSESQMRSELRRFGLTPGRLLRVLRLRTAAERLRYGGDSVGSVAAQCGFSDQFVFARAFKREFGVSPRGYRRAYRAESGAR